jgi:FlaA1/EpsC-like NDP-sugar epimerase
MSYNKQLSLFFGLDLAVVWLSAFMAFTFGRSGAELTGYDGTFLLFGVIATLSCMSAMIYFKLYGRLWKFASVGELASLVKAVLLGGTIAYFAASLALGSLLPASVGVAMLETTLLLMGGVRFAWRFVKLNAKGNTEHRRKVLVIGAGSCGMMVVREMLYAKETQLEPVAFIDDDPNKTKLTIMDVPVVGGREYILQTVEKLGIEDILIAMPSVSRRDILEMIDICKLTRAKLKIIPGLTDLIDGSVSLKTMRDVDVEDLLGRDPIKVDLQGIAEYVEGKTVLVTGAGGSIGSELCRQISAYGPQRLLLLGHGENSIYAIEMELRRLFPQLAIEPIIADVQDRERIHGLFEAYAPQVVFHAAAHKHVPLMERNPAEAIKNNVFGTKNVADAAERYGAERFVLISTDKAVNPTSVMGTTKRIAEMYIQSLNKNRKTIFAAVRFGNVLGSRGSVIPRFREQIAAGGPVTVTHPEMIRYFMTIPEAVQLVIQAGAFARGGEVFVLDMGEPVKIVDLAHDLIRLSGFEPNADIEIRYTGMRPGEKLYEELLTSEEGLTSTKHNRIFIGRPSPVSHADMEFQIKRFEKILADGPSVIRDVLQHTVPTYRNETNREREKELTRV